MHVLREYPSRGLYGEEKSVGVLFFCLLLLPFVLCCALFSLKLEGWPTGSYSFASVKGSTTALIPLMPLLSAKTRTEHWLSKKSLQQVTVISWSNIYSSEYDLSLYIIFFDDCMQVSVKVNHQLLTYFILFSVCSFLSIPVETCRKSLCKVIFIKYVFCLFHPHFFIWYWKLSGHHKGEQTLVVALLSSIWVFKLHTDDAYIKTLIFACCACKVFW